MLGSGIDGSFCLGRQWNNEIVVIVYSTNQIFKVTLVLKNDSCSGVWFGLGGETRKQRGVICMSSEEGQDVH